MRVFNSRRTIYLMAAVAIFGALAIVLYVVPVFSFNLVIFPSFLQIHLDEIPIFIAGYAFGPVAAIATTVIKTIPKLFMSSTATIGEFCDLILTLAFVLPATILFKYKKGPWWIALGLGISFISQIVVASIVTTFIILPVYMSVLNIPYDGLLGMIQRIIPSVTNLNIAYITFVAIPFNSIKNGIVIAATVIVFVPLFPLVRKLRSLNESSVSSRNSVIPHYIFLFVIIVVFVLLGILL